MTELMTLDVLLAATVAVANHPTFTKEMEPHSLHHETVTPAIAQRVLVAYKMVLDAERQQ